MVLRIKKYSEEMHNILLSIGSDKPRYYKWYHFMHFSLHQIGNYPRMAYLAIKKIKFRP